MSEIEDLKKQLRELSSVVNSFKSEAVQLRVLEALLQALGSGSFRPPVAPRAYKRARKSRAKARSKKVAATGARPSASAKAVKSSKGKSSARRGGSPGAWSMVNQLYDDGFFKTARAIGAITSHTESAFGHKYKANELSPVLLRLLRDKKLGRKKNENGQYEYSQA